MPPYQYNSMMAQNNYEQSLKNIINQANSQLQQLKTQPTPIMPQQPQIHQNFQLAPQSNSNNSDLESEYANNIDEVKNTFVSKTGLFITKDFSTIWVKDVTGNIRTFKTEEIVEMDEKDKEIYMLKKEIEEMKGMINNANEPVNTESNEPITSKKSTRTSTGSKPNAK